MFFFRKKKVLLFNKPINILPLTAPQIIIEISDKTFIYACSPCATCQ